MIQIAFRGTRKVIHTLDIDMRAVRTRSKSTDVDADRVESSDPS
jgi:hypothetical protein